MKNIQNAPLLHRVWFVVLLFVMLIPLISAETIDIQQTSGGDTFNFYYGCSVSDCGTGSSDSHRWAVQTFTPSVERITRVELKLKAITSSTWNPCDPLYRDRNLFDVHIRDQYGNFLASSTGNSICEGIIDSFVWRSIPFSSPASVTRGQPYEIYIQYRGDTLRNSPNFAWERATFDAYASGTFRYNDNGATASSPRDAVFRTYGESCTDNDGDGYGTGCALGADCNDNDRAVHQTSIYYLDSDGDGFGSSSSTASCGQPPGYAGNSNDCNDGNRFINPDAAEICDGVDNNCRNGIDETFDLQNDNNNCGSCGNACSAYQSCTSGSCTLNTNACNTNADCSTGYSCQANSCVLDTTAIDVVILSPSLFIDVIHQAQSRGIDTSQFSSVVESLSSGYSTTRTPFDAAVITGNAIRSFIDIFDAVHTDFMGYSYYWKTLSDGTQVLKVANTANWLDDLIETTPVLQNTLRSISQAQEALPMLDIVVSFITGFSRGTGDTLGDYTFNSLIYTGGQLITGPYRVAHFLSDIGTHLVGQDNTLAYPVFSAIRDTMADLITYYESGLPRSECAQSLEGWVSCGTYLLDSFTHPLAFVTDVVPVQGSDRVTFRVTARNYWAYTGGIVFIGASVVDSTGTPLCNVQWQQVSFAPGETKTMEFVWNVPDGTPRDREYRFVTQVWYSCNAGCETPDGCLSGGCCSNPMRYSNRETPFLLSNNPPILNALDCEGVACGSSTDIYEGQELDITVYGSELDGESLTFTYDFLGSPDHPEILGIILDRDAYWDCIGDGSWDPCHFRWRPDQGLAGIYNFRFKVCDGYACDTRDLAIQVLSNAPRLQSPLNTALIHTLTPTFRWHPVAFRDYYQMWVYPRGSNVDLCCAQPIYDTLFRLPEEYRLESGREYEWKVTATTIDGAMLESERWWFRANCFIDSECGENQLLEAPLCGADGQVYQDELRYRCNNPGTISAYCSSETVQVQVDTCPLGCTEGRCMLGCAVNDPPCAEGYACLDNACVEIDEDGDGYTILNDCDDTDREAWQYLPGYRDADGDTSTVGIASEICAGNALPAGYREAPSSGEDCDDADGTRWLQQMVYADSDGDGYSATRSQVELCRGKQLPAGYAEHSAGYDCNDSNGAVHEGVREICDGQDNDCDGYVDENACGGNGMPSRRFRRR